MILPLLTLAIFSPPLALCAGLGMLTYSTLMQWSF